MARAEFTVASLGSLNPTASVEAAFTSVSAIDGMEYLATGREIVLVRNVSEDTDFDLTVLSVANAYGRGASNANPAVFTIPFGETHSFMVGKDGWLNRTTRTVQINAEDAALEVAVLRLPNGL